MPNAPFAQVRDVLVALILILFTFCMTLALRMDMFFQRSGAQGVEATYHLLWTGIALNASDPAAHLYLPTVTLAPTPGNPISWGATVPTPGGAYVYTSFPPLGFLLPATTLSAIGSNGSFIKLTLLNSLVGLVAALLMGGLARATVLSIGQFREKSERDGWAVFALNAIVYLFLRESLVSHGAVVWPHSLSQLCLITGCWLALRIFTQRASYGTIAGIAFIAVLYPSLEWSGFIFNAGLFAALVYHGLSSSRERSLSIVAAAVAAIATIVAGIGMLLHFAAAVGVDSLLSALVNRASARAFDKFVPIELPFGYFVSFGALLPLSVFALKYLRSSPAIPTSRKKVFWLLLFVASFAMVENLIQMQHATQFSFDRLKLAVPLLLINSMAWWMSSMPVGKPHLLLGLVTVVIWSNLQIFSHDILYYQSWGRIQQTNTRIANQLSRDPLTECSVVGTNLVVRGYMNLTLGRDMREKTLPEQLLKVLRRDEACGVIFVRAVPTPYPDLPEFVAIEVYSREGTLLRRYDGT